MGKTLLISLCSFGLAAGTFAQSTQVLADTSLEVSGPGSAPWTSTSVNFGTVLCDAAGCGTCGGPCVPNSGSWYAWFGGTSNAEVGTISQTFNVATDGTAHLNFKIKVPMKGATTDSLVARIDGNPVYAVATSDSIGAYTSVVTTPKFLTAGSHTIVLRASKLAGANVCNVLVDDITLVIGSFAGTTEIDFSNGITLFANNENQLINISMNLLQAADLRISVSDMVGKTVYNTTQKNAQYNAFTIPTDSWTAGVYNVTIRGNNGYSLTKKVYIQQ